MRVVPAAINNPPASFTFQICVTDTPNATMPAGSALPNTAGNSYVMKVLNPYAYVADPGMNQIDDLNTGTPSVSPSTALAATVSATSPDGAAVTPNGRLAYVTLSSTNQIAVIDTASNAPISGSPFSLPAGCTAPHGVTPYARRFASLYRLLERE